VNSAEWAAASGNYVICSTASNLVIKSVSVFSLELLGVILIEI